MLQTSLAVERPYLVGDSGLTVHVDYTTWGWIHLIFGLITVTGWRS